MTDQEKYTAKMRRNSARQDHPTGESAKRRREKTAERKTVASKRGRMLRRQEEAKHVPPPACDPDPKPVFANPIAAMMRGISLGIKAREKSNR